MPNIAAGASATVILSAGTTLSITGFGTVTLGPGPKANSLFGLDGDGVIGPFAWTQRLYISASSDLDYREGAAQTGTGDASGYVLPVATFNTLGGVKAGANVTIAADGTLSAAAGGGAVDLSGGLTIGDLPAAPVTIPDTYALELYDPSTGASYKATVAALKTIFGGSTSVPVAPTVTSVSVTPSTANVAGGATQTFAATVTGTNSPAQTVTWEASLGAITSSGVFTAPASTASTQTITITARSTVDTTRTGTATVTVAATGTPAPTVTSVTVSPATASVSGGATQQFTASVAGTDSPSQGVTWTANAGSINSSTGLFTAPSATASVQTITVTATSAQDATKSGTATVTVAAAAQQAGPFTVDTPATQKAGVEFSLTGTYTGTVTAMDYSWDGGATWQLPRTATVGSGAFSLLVYVNAENASQVLKVRSRTTPADQGATAAFAVTAPTAYTIAGYGTPPNSIRDTLDASDANKSNTTDYTPLRQFTNSKFSAATTNQQYWSINATTGGAQPASCYFGWSDSATVPPPMLPASGSGSNANGSTSKNGFVLMTKATAFGNNAALWITIGDNSKKYPWVKPSDGVAFCFVPAGMTITNA